MGFRLAQLSVGLLLSSASVAHAVKIGALVPWARKKGCENTLAKEFKSDEGALNSLVEQMTTLDPDIEKDPTFRNVKYYILPRQRWGSDLILLAIYGGSKEGKSSLLNAIPAMIYNHGKVPERQDPTHRLDRKIATTGDTTGRTTRPTVAISGRQVSNSVKPDLLDRVPELRLYVNAEETESSTEATPLLYEDINLPSGVAVADLPPRTSGDPRISDKPQFRDTVERMLASADMMLVIMDKKSVDNHDVLSSIRETFKNYGRKQLITVYQGDRDMPPEKAIEQSNRFAQSAFDLPLEYAGKPHGVTAQYLMPYNPLVERGQAHVELVPLGDSPAFVDLLNQLSESPRKFKDKALLDASENFRAQAISRVREDHKRRLAAQIYAEAIEALTLTVIWDHLREFPYEQSRRIWREAVERRRTLPIQIMNRMAEVLGRFEIFVAPAMRQMLREVVKVVKGKGDEIGRPGDLPTFEVYGKGAVTDFQTQLNSRYLRLRASPRTANLRATGAQLAARIETFYGYFPEERGNDAPCEEADDRVCVHLPRRELLSDDTRATIERSLHADPGELMNRLSKAVPAELAINSDEVQSALRDLGRRRGVGAFTRDLFFDFAGIFSFTYLFFTVPSNLPEGSAGILAGVAFGHVTARIFRMLGEQGRDQSAKPAFDTWFKELQLKTYRRVFDTDLLREVKTAVKLDQDQHFTAMREAQRALRHLDPSVREYPAELTDAVAHEK